MSSVNIWLHCNKCYVRFNQHKEFCLTKCGHILCSKCANNIGRDQTCPLCKAVGTIWPLNKDLPQEISQFFQSTDATMKHAIKIIEFQNTNKGKLISHLSDKYNHAKTEYMRLLQAYKTQMTEIQRLKADIQRLKERLLASPEISAAMDVSGSNRNRSSYSGYHVPESNLSINSNSFSAPVQSAADIPTFARQRSSSHRFPQYQSRGEPNGSIQSGHSVRLQSLSDFFIKGGRR